MEEIKTLLGLLTWLLTPGAGIAAYWLIEEIPQLKQLLPKTKRYTAYALSSLIAVASYLFMVAMQYRPVPEDWRQWVEVLSSVALVASGVSQLLHGVVKLK